MSVNTCHRCPLAVSAGSVRCKLDGVGLGAHAAAGYCPDKRYGDGVKPEGWGVEVMPAIDVRPARKPIEPVPRARWPRVVKLIAWRRREGEKGVGDTLARLIPAGEAMKAFTKKHGIDCGCSRRQERANAMYPYPH